MDSRRDVDEEISPVRVRGLSGPHSIRVRHGRIASIEPLPGADPGSTVPLALPAFVDGHVHLDKTFLGIAWVPHQGAADVKSRIAVEKTLRRAHAGSSALRSRALAERLIAHGTTAARTHVDIDEETRLSGFERLRALREALAERIDIQIVAFPQSGLSAAPSVAADLAIAAAEGADAIGAVDPTTIDGDVDGVLDTVFALAERHALAVDVHLHEAGAMGAAVILAMCDRTRALSMAGRVTVSHGFCLAQLDDAALGRTAGAMADAGVALMTSAPGPSALVPLLRLRQAGVLVFAGSDNIRDAWAPFGNGDMLDRARLVAYRADLRTDEGLRLAFDMATVLSARGIGAPARALAPGDLADFVLVDTPTVEQAVCDVPAVRRVYRKGRPVQAPPPDA